jgi:hypothetical protein
LLANLKLTKMANVMENRISTTFTETELKDLKTARDAYMNILQAKTLALTADELDSLSSMAVSNFVFVKDTLQASDAEGLSILPPAIAAMMPEAGKDANVFAQFDAEELMLLDMLTRIQHTKRVAAHEAYSVCSKAYRQYQMLAEAGVPGAVTRYNALKDRFKENGSSGRPAETGA